MFSENKISTPHLVIWKYYLRLKFIEKNEWKMLRSKRLFLDITYWLTLTPSCKFLEWKRVYILQVVSGVGTLSTLHPTPFTFAKKKIVPLEKEFFGKNLPLLKRGGWRGRDLQFKLKGGKSWNWCKVRTLKDSDIMNHICYQRKIAKKITKISIFLTFFLFFKKHFPKSKTFLISKLYAKKK